jgi:hypothetical protein
MTKAKPAVVRYYVDADVLGLGKLLAGLRSDVTFPGDPGAEIKKRQPAVCPISSPATDDDVWIPQTAVNGWLAITRDSAIQERASEIGAVCRSGARLVALAGKEARGTWEQLEIVMCQWREIERLTAAPGPFIYTATRTSLNRVAIN